MAGDAYHPHVPRHLRRRHNGCEDWSGLPPPHTCLRCPPPWDAPGPCIHLPCKCHGPCASCMLHTASCCCVAPWPVSCVGLRRWSVARWSCGNGCAVCGRGVLCVQKTRHPNHQMPICPVSAVCETRAANSGCAMVVGFHIGKKIVKIKVQASTFGHCCQRGC